MDDAFTWDCLCRYHPESKSKKVRFKGLDNKKKNQGKNYTIIQKQTWWRIGGNYVSVNFRWLLFSDVWKLVQRSLKWVQFRCSSFIRLDAVQHWSWHVIFDRTEFFFFWQSDFWPPLTVFDAVAKRIELEQWDWSHFEALSKGFNYLFLFFYLHDV